jgi:trehalose 6-phosphate phosphatase
VTKHPPPILDPVRHALFLDFDGSLVDFAMRPDEIVVRPETIHVLERLFRRFGGALAIVTGRHIADVEEHLAPLKIPASGVHGVEFRSKPDEIRIAPISEELEEVRRRLADAVPRHDPVYVEDKGEAFVLHFRQHPDQEARAGRIAEEVVEGLDTLQAVKGHAIFEIRQRDITKANAVRRFMRRPPFHGRTPVFVGDDVTDEDGMREAAAEGGFGVKIGPGRTFAAYRLPDTSAVHNWLSRLTEGRTFGGTVAVSER